MAKDILFSELVTLFVKHSGLHLARLHCLAELVVCVIRCRTVNLVQLSQVFGSDAKRTSSYIRLRRFLAEVRFDACILARMISAISGLPQDCRWTLMLDRTNWKFGKIHINYLVLSAAHPQGSSAVPLFWMLLPDKKQGNSDYQDRTDLLELFCETFGCERIAEVIGDREFIGKKWFAYLQEQTIAFAMRLKEGNAWLSNSQGELVPATDLFHDLKPGETRSLGLRRIAKTHRLKTYVTASRNAKNELLIVAHDATMVRPTEIYGKRWDIEVLFKCIKSNGFDLETTHVTDPERLQTLMGVVALAVSCAYRFGIWHHQHHPPKIKKHGYLAVSVFRQGLDFIQHILANGNQIWVNANEVIRELFNHISGFQCFVR